MGGIDQAVSALAGQVAGLGLGQGLGGMDPLLSGWGNGSSSSVGGSVLGTSVGGDTPLGGPTTAPGGACGGEGGSASMGGPLNPLPSSQSPVVVVELVTKPSIIERMATVNVDVLTATLPTVYPYCILSID